jgi:predicted small secreted protein
MKMKVYRIIFYLATTLSLASCDSLQGVSKGISGAFKGFRNLIP